MTSPTLLVAAESRAWRRRLGALAWAALEHLALAGHPDELGWVAPVGVRDIAAGLGVTKDTAARAVTVLATAGLVTRTQVETSDKRHRSGYRLHLPAGIETQFGPGEADTSSQRGGPDRCPSNHDKPISPTEPDSVLTVKVAFPDSERHGPERVRSYRDRLGPREATAVSQPTLFDPGDTVSGEGAS